MTTPITLPNLAAWADVKAGNRDTPPGEAWLWRVIADEIGDYLHPTNQHTLFDPTETRPS